MLFSVAEAICQPCHAIVLFFIYGLDSKFWVSLAPLSIYGFEYCKHLARYGVLQSHAMAHAQTVPKVKLAYWPWHFIQQIIKRTLCPKKLSLIRPYSLMPTLQFATKQPVQKPLATLTAAITVAAVATFSVTLILPSSFLSTKMRNSILLELPAVLVNIVYCSTKIGRLQY